MECKTMTRNEIINEINQCRNILEQNDHHGRKVAFEVAAKLKEKFSDILLPNYEKYLESETVAAAKRERINELEKLLETATDEAVDEREL